MSDATQRSRRSPDRLPDIRSDGRPSYTAALQPRPATTGRRPRSLDGPAWWESGGDSTLPDVRDWAPVGVLALRRSPGRSAASNRPPSGLDDGDLRVRSDLDRFLADNRLAPEDLPDPTGGGRSDRDDGGRSRPGEESAAERRRARRERREQRDRQDRRGKRDR